MMLGPTVAALLLLSIADCCVAPSESQRNGIFVPSDFIVTILRPVS